MSTAIILPKKGIPFEAELEIVKHSFEGTKFFVEGYVSTTDYDLQGHVISMDAIRGSKNDLLENSTILYNHDPNRPIAKTVMTKFNSKGLFVRAEVSTTEIEIREKIREGILNKFSIRGRVLDAVDEKSADGVETKVIKRMYLTECSLVSVPANTKAEVVRWWETEKSLLGGIVKSLNNYSEEGGKSEMKNENATREEVTKAWVEHIKEAGLEKSSADELDAEFLLFVKTNGFPEGERPDSDAIVGLIDKLIEAEEDEEKKAILLQLKELVSAPEPDAGEEKPEDVEVQEAAGDGKGQAEKAGSDTELDADGNPLPAPGETPVKKEDEPADPPAEDGATPAEEAKPAEDKEAVKPVEPAAEEAKPADGDAATPADGKEVTKKTNEELEAENTELKKQLMQTPNARKGVVSPDAGKMGMDKFHEAPPINRAVAAVAKLFGHKSTGR